MHRLADSFEFLIKKKKMFSKWILQNRELRRTERMYMKKVPEKTFSFLQQFMMISTLEVYNVDWDSHLTEIGMNYTLKEKMGYDPVIQGNNDPWAWARIVATTEWVEYHLHRHLDLREKSPRVQVFNQPGIDEPDWIIENFIVNLEVLGNIKDVNENPTAVLPYYEIYSEGDFVYERIWVLSINSTDYRSMLEGTYFDRGIGSDQ
jgi:hypothetical protein